MKKPSPKLPAAGAPPVLSVSALNRALLARQLLLARETIPVQRAIEQLAGLQAQQARPPFIGLWSRLENFERAELSRLLHERRVVRVTAMRGTLHLLTADDFIALRAALQPALTRGMNSVLRERLTGLDVPVLVRKGREFFDAKPRTFTELRAELLQAFPNGDERAMGYAVRTHLPLVVRPDGSDWGFGGDGDFAVGETWLGRPLAVEIAPHALVRRYLAAFGPATAADFQAWSALPGAQAVLEELRPELAVFRDERKRELFDLPEAPRPPAGTPAPVRFIADFDNLILSHADRSRIIAEDYRSRVVTKNLLVLATFLVDGFVAGTWKIARTKQTATLAISPFAKLAATTKAELRVEGAKLVRFVEPTAEKFEIEFGSPDARQ